MSLRDLHTAQGAHLAPDGIPQHYGDLTAEYHAALQNAVLMDRSHEGRFEVTGKSRIDLMQRMSTNDLLNMREGEGRATIFTSPTARILDRVLVYQRGDKTLVTTEAGRGQSMRGYLQRNIFFGDDVQLTDLADSTRLFALHGPNADAIIGALITGAAEIPPLFSAEAEIAGVPVFIARRKPLSGAHWIVIAPIEQAAKVWSAILDAGALHGLRPAGSLTYNSLRIRSGRPAGRELSEDYIPLEVGLWDEISFKKGCYTGQEIIARMESRSRLAKVMVQVRLSAPAEAPAEIFYAGHKVGILTSSVTTPDAENIGIAVVKLAQSQPEMVLSIGAQNEINAIVINLAAAPPPEIFTELAER